MKDYKLVLRLFRISIVETLRSVVFWLVLGIFFLVLLYLCGSVGDFLVKNNYRMNLFELYIWFQSIKFSRVIYLACLLLLICGITFFHKGASYYLLRINRKIWIQSQIIHLLAVIIFVNFTMLIAFWVGCHGAINAVGEWSGAAFLACQFGAQEIGLGMSFYANPYLLGQNPNVLGVVALILTILNSLLVGMVILACQAKGKTFLGIILVLGFWFGEMMMLIENFDHPILPYLTPFRLSMISLIGINGAGPSVVYAIVYHVVFCVVVRYVLMKFSKQVDFLKME